MIQRERTTNEVSSAGKDVHCEESLFPLKFLNIDYQICIQCSRRTGKKIVSHRRSTSKSQIVSVLHFVEE